MENTSVVKIDDLPGEVQDLIFDFTIAGVSREELKTFRLSNQFFQSRIDRTLFATLHVSASDLSLKRLKTIAAHPHLACHVRELIFHRGTFTGHRMCRMYRGGLGAKDYGDFEAYIVQNRAYAKHLSRVSKAYVNFQEELQSESKFNREWNWRSTLSKECQNFPKLDTLTLLNGAKDIEFSTYFDKHCGLQHQSYTPDYFTPYEIMGSTGPRDKLRALNFDAVNGEDFARMITDVGDGLQAIHSQFSELRKLSLTFSETVSSLPIPRSYALFFQSLDNIEDLFLGFPTFALDKIMKDSASFPPRLLKIVLSQEYPKLTSFGIENAAMSENDYINFLSKHTKTLQVIRLNNWGVSLDSSDDSPGSFNRAMYRIGQMRMPLFRRVMWKGQFSNDGTTWTEFGANAESSNVNDIHVQHLYDYMLGKRSDFPLEISFDSS